MKDIYEVYDGRGTRLGTETRIEAILEDAKKNGSIVSIDPIAKIVIMKPPGKIDLSDERQLWRNIRDNAQLHVSDEGVCVQLPKKTGEGKPRLSNVPPISLFHLGKAMDDGANKYGRFNWRDSYVIFSVFFDAMQRHLIAWYSGEDIAPDSGCHHLAHVMANCAIILDALDNNKQKDDRTEGSPVTSENWREMY